MKTQDWEKLGVQTYGLTPDLIVPIAAVDIEHIDKYVGTIEFQILGRRRPINGVVVRAYQPERNLSIPLWKNSKGTGYYEKLHPSRQLWVHIDYTGYRKAWQRLGFDKLTSKIFLDHILNRASVRISGYKHPFIRLCPISRKTNTNSGLGKGAEGMQKEELRK